MGIVTMRVSSVVASAAFLLFLLHASSGAKKSYHKQLCVVTNSACRVPYDDRPAEAIKALHTPASKSAPKGHLKPVGHPDFNGIWDGELPTYKEGTNMSPEEFWTKYYPTEPFILKGVAKKDPAYTNWQDDQYIIKNFGHIKAKAENKNEDRLTDYCGMNKLGDRVACDSSVKPYEETYLNFSRFMQNYRKPNWDEYIISQLPDDMAKEVGVVPAWYCGKRHEMDKKYGYDHNNGKMDIMKGRPWLTQMYESNIWINYNEGRNFSSSVIHYDMNHQMMCLYAGKKEWITWDPAKYIDDIPMWSKYLQRSGNRVLPPQGSDDSPIDPERVDLESFPEFGKAHWRNTTMEPGDCMYLPAWHLHYVRSFGRNIAGMYMFQTGQQYDPSTCENVPKTSTPLGDFDILWNFPGAPNTAGHNQVKMGYPDWKKAFREPLAQMARGSKINKDAFVQWYAQHLAGGGGMQDGDDSDDGAGDNDMVTEQAENIFKNIAGQGGEIDVAELYRNQKLAELFRTVAVNQEGRPDQDMDTRIMRFDLASNKKQVRDTDEL